MAARTPRARFATPRLSPASAIADDREHDNGWDTAANPLPPGTAIEPNGTIIFRHCLRLAGGRENGHAVWPTAVDEALTLPGSSGVAK
jgi:hypothetical protein